MEWGQEENPWSRKPSLGDDTFEKVLAVHVAEAENQAGLEERKGWIWEEGQQGMVGLECQDKSLALPKNHWRLSTGKAQIQFVLQKHRDRRGRTVGKAGVGMAGQQEGAVGV